VLDFATEVDVPTPMCLALGVISKPVVDTGNDVQGAVLPLADDTAVLARIRAAIPSLPRSDAAVARTITANPERVASQSITEVAEDAATSASTVSRCAQRLGFEGFQALRLAIVRELGPDGKRAAPERRGDSPLEVLDYVLAMQLESVRSVPATLDRAQFEGAVKALAKARNVVFAGIGANLALIHDAGHVAEHIGLSAKAPSDVYAQQFAARRLHDGDVCVVISQTGSSRDSVATQQIAREAGATTVAVTGFLRSPLTELSDYCLVAGQPTMTYELDSISARMAMKAVVDALLVATAARNQPRTDETWAIATEIATRNVY
jgi:RpiR family transcriptional regulator, carbohydrate utilization regulator